MLKNHILLAFRHLKKEKVYTLSTILGLALAFTGCFFTFGFILHEYTADSHFADPEHTYRLKSNLAADSPITFSFLAVSNAQYMEDHFPEVNFSVPVYMGRINEEIAVAENIFIENHWAYTEPQVLYLFDSTYFDVRSSFEAGTVLVSEATVFKWFGEKDPIGELVTLKEGTYTVAGTFKDFPTNSHLVVNALAIPLAAKMVENNDGLVYVHVRADAKIDDLNRKVDRESVNMDKFIAETRISLISVKNVYLDQGEQGGLLRKADTEMVNTMSIISLIILSISTFNIINLTQVKTLFRGRETGVKKVLGITPGQMFFQFFVESAMVVMLAALLSASFIQMSAKEVLSYLHISGFSSNIIAALLLFLMLSMTILLAAIQNAFFSKVLPRDVIVGKFKVGERKWLLKAMVSLQFVIACTLIGGTFLVGKQMDYIISKPLGFSIGDLWYIPGFSEETDLSLLRDRLAAIPEVQSATISGGLPFVEVGGLVTASHESKEFVSVIEIDKNFFSTFQIPFVDEPAFIPDSGVIANERMMASETVNIRDYYGRDIFGVVADFHFNSLSSPIGVLLLSLGDPSYGRGYLTMRIKNDMRAIAEGKLQAEWDILFPDLPFELLSLHDAYLQKHHEARKLAVVLKALSFIAVFISCIGLASLTGFFVRKRFKEIAIRKVLGASVLQVIREVNTSYIFVILAATVASVGLVYHYGGEWLANYAYATTIDALILVAPGLILLLVSGSIMIAQTWSTARANPVEALRTE